MVKRINVSVPDELYEKIQLAKQGFSREFSLSKIFQKAIENELEDAIRRATVWNDGYQYGTEYLKSLDYEEQLKVKKMVINFPRRLPKDILKPLLIVDVITETNLNKHTRLRHYWKAVDERFDFPIGVRYDKVKELWRKGLIAGIKDATKPLGGTPGETTNT